MTTTSSASRQTVRVHGTEVELFTGGEGPSLLFLHGAGGNSGWQHYHEELSKTYKVYVPSQPGFNGTESQTGSIPLPMCVISTGH